MNKEDPRLGTSRLDDERTPSPEHNSEGSVQSELRRQMEAAKQRMNRYHAVYRQSGHASEDDPQS